MGDQEDVADLLDDWDDFDDQDGELLPCTLNYVFVCVCLPALNGALNAFVWPAYTLHFDQQGWSLVTAGLAVTIGFILRMTTQQMQLYTGYWLIVPLNVIHLAFAVIGLLYPTTEWAVCAQIVAVQGIDPTCAVEGIAFDTFGESEVQARQASSTVLSVFTIAIALSCTMGGFIFDFAGWFGISIYHTVCEGMLLLILIIQPACRNSFREVFFSPKKDELVDENPEGSDALDAEKGFAAVVPEPRETTEETKETAKETTKETTKEATKEVKEAPSLPGAIEDAEPAEVEEPSAAAPADDQVEDVKAEKDEAKEAEAAGLEPPSQPPAEAPNSTADNPRSKRTSEAPRKSQHTPRSSMVQRKSQARNARASGRVSGFVPRVTVHSAISTGEAMPRLTIRGRFGRYSCHTNATGSTGGSGGSGKTGGTRLRGRQTQMTGKTGATASSRGTMGTMRTAMTAFSTLTNLSRAGHDFQHHFGTSMALQPQIVGATGNGAVMRDEVLALDEEGVAVEIAAPTGTGKIPKDVRLPAFLVVLNCFINTGSYVIEFATFAIYFKQVHNWTDASLASMAQTAGDVMAAIAMQVIPVFFNTDYDPDDLGGCKRTLHYLFSKPYNLSFILLTWIIWNVGMMSPWLPVAIVAQVFMGTTYVYSSKWATEMNLSIAEQRNPSAESWVAC